jgi:membrane protease YdiL (CAAX protease family)
MRILVPPSGVSAKLISCGSEMGSDSAAPNKTGGPVTRTHTLRVWHAWPFDLNSNAASRDRPLWSLTGLLVLGAFGTSILSQLFVLLLNQQTGTTSIASETPLTLARGALIVQSALAIVVGLTLRRSSTLRERTFRFERVTIGMLLTSIGLTLGIAPLANELGTRLSEALHVPPESTRWVTLVIQRANVGELLLLGSALTVVPACVEELLFRGLLTGTLAGAHRGVQLALPALLFGVFHADWAQGAATFVLGLGFGFLRLTTRSLLVPMVCHALYNLLVLVTMRSMSNTEPEAHQALGVLSAGLLLAVACGVVLERQCRSNSRLREVS